MYNKVEPYAKIYKSEVARLGELTRTEMLVWLCLKLYRNQKTGRCCPSRVTISVITQIKTTHVSTGIKGLVDKGWIEAMKGEYRLKRITKSVTNKVTESVITETVIKNNGSRNKNTENRNSLNKEEQRLEQRKEHNTPAADRGKGKNEIDIVFEFYTKTFGKGPRFTLTKKRKDRIRDRLKNKSVADLFDAILGCHARPFVNKDSGVVYDDIELICRTDDKVEYFIEQLERGSRPTVERFPVDRDQGPPAVVAVFTPRPPAVDIPAADLDAWKRLRSAIAAKVAPELFDVWFGPVVFDGLAADPPAFRLRAASIAVDWIREVYAGTVGECLAAVGLAGYKIIWEVEDAEKCEPKQATA
jgi:DNA-binding MarR family transcriptional regulator